MTQTPTLSLNDGRNIPQLGFGTYQIDNDDAAEAVSTALHVGYKLVDTAAIYGNEEGVGEGLGSHRDIWLTTKIWNESQGYERAKAAFAKCLARLDRPVVDLVLIHWPCAENDKYVETWKAMIEMREAGTARSIGVSNFQPDHLKRLADETGEVPALNQIELHPSFQQRDLRKLHDEMGIVTQSWSPLGQGNGLDNETIKAIAKETGQNAAAVIIRWHIQHGLAVIPKASSRDHIAANFEAVRFELDDDQMARIDALDDKDGRIGPHPDEFC
ncbi:MAG: aldo/keto reductase [Sphingomonadaceae bacterium]